MTPAAVRVVSLEPLCGPVDIEAAGLISRSEDPELGAFWERAVDWVLIGGENAERAQPMHPAWPRRIIADCAKAGIAVFFKQWGTCEPLGPVPWTGDDAPPELYRAAADMRGLGWAARAPIVGLNGELMSDEDAASAGNGRPRDLRPWLFGRVEHKGDVPRTIDGRMVEEWPEPGRPTVRPASAEAARAAGAAE